MDENEGDKINIYLEKKAKGISKEIDALMGEHFAVILIAVNEAGEMTAISNKSNKLSGIILKEAQVGLIDI